MNSIKLQIEPRFVKEENGFRPFQIQTIDAIKNSDAKIIMVEAPVGSGKSYIIRNLIKDDYFKDKPIILTYPTKILMDAQVASMRQELDDIAIWPDDEFIVNGVNILNYSSSSLIRYLKRENISEKLDKGELLEYLIMGSGVLSKKRVIVTSPDVLHILINLKRYCSKSFSRRLANKLQGAYVFFDEFHTYTNLKHFPVLIKTLLDTIALKIILLSATPYESEKLKEVRKDFPSENINFSSSVARSEKEGVEFNYPLDVEIEVFRYTDRKQSLGRLVELIPKVKKPAAIIFDSIFRLQHLKSRIYKEFSSDYMIQEWHGMEKSKDFLLDENTIVLGTSSIEVGVDMDFKTLITEASYWTSAIQRIGRVGRKDNGKVILFTNAADFRPLLDRDKYSRTEFEGILKKSLRDPIGQQIGGTMFRGDSYNFILRDIDTKKVHTYSQNLFAMYAIHDDYEDEWKTLDYEDKKEILEDWCIGKNRIKELLLFDRIFEFWGAVEGRLKSRYDRVDIGYPNKDNNFTLSIQSNDTYTFYGK